MVSRVSRYLFFESLLFSVLTLTSDETGLTHSWAAKIYFGWPVDGAQAARPALGVQLVFSCGLQGFSAITNTTRTAIWSDCSPTVALPSALK